MSAKRPATLYIHNSSVLSGCEAYRMWLPGEELMLHGYQARMVHHYQLGVWAERARITGEPGPGAYDLFVVPRGGLSSGPAVDALKATGKRLIFEIDDDFTNEYRVVIQEQVDYERIWNFARHLADGITVSTPYLAEVVRRRVGGRVPIYVLPNSVRMGMWQGLERAERLTLGLTGSITHDKDWAVLADALPAVLANHPQVDLNVAGFVPDWVGDLQARYPERVFTDTTWHDYREYPTIVGRAHIVLCPVEPTDPFNWSKSGIKAIEGLAAGAAVIASDINIYQPVIGPNKRGLLVDFRPESWYEAIHTLIIDSGLRQQLAARGRMWVNKRHNIALNWGCWLKAYQEIASR